MCSLLSQAFKHSRLCMTEFLWGIASCFELEVGSCAAQHDVDKLVMQRHSLPHVKITYTVSFILTRAVPTVGVWP